MADMQIDHGWEQIDNKADQYHEPNNAEEDDEEDDDILGLNEEDEVDEQLANQRLVLMMFCPHDSSMLYPMENKRTRTLTYTCRLCQHREDSTNNLVYRNVIKKEVGKPFKLVITGGFSSLFKKSIKTKLKQDKDITIKGLIKISKLIK